MDNFKIYTLSPLLRNTVPWWLKCSDRILGRTGSTKGLSYRTQQIKDMQHPCLRLVFRSTEWTKASTQTRWGKQRGTWLMSLVHAAFSCREGAKRTTVKGGASVGSTMSLKSRCPNTCPEPFALQPERERKSHNVKLQSIRQRKQWFHLKWKLL